MRRDLSAGKAPIAYFHPWDFESGSGKMEAGLLNRFIGTHTSGDTWHKFNELLGRYPICTLDDYRRTLRDVPEHRGANQPREGQR
jgi:hypothetical protein